MIQMTAPVYSVPLHTRILRTVLRPIFRGIFHILSRVRITGRENVPQGGAYLIAINHVSLYEAPFILAFWPVTPEAVGAVDIWSRPGQSILARIYGGIPVHRGEYDRSLVETMKSVLESGRPILIAPEGGRSHTPGMRRGLPGAAFVVEQAATPVVPVGIAGATDDFLALALRGKRPVIEMHIGKPMRLRPVEGKGQARREARQRNADRIMFQIAALLPPEYRGVYAEGALAESDSGNEPQESPKHRELEHPDDSRQHERKTDRDGPL
ncbi:MAG: 1-acyl-sn-glycerol-3-phosphate acyltransferase [Anaerolineales bacterium]|nr:1-acyl-sn-glycerol-3-phosphate acyltransferase [Anaerolineales bacterium]